MITRIQLNQTLAKILGKDLLQKARVKDEHGPNGLQLRGTEKISKIITGVSLSAESMQQAAQQKAQAIITHHGMQMNFPYHIVLPDQQFRLELALGHELNLYGYHYALDAHPTLGNNAQLAKLLQAKIIAPYFDEWGFVAQLPQSMKLTDLSEKLTKLFNHDVFVVEVGQETVQTLGIVSGGGVPRQKEILEMLEKKVDVHITGEIRESQPYQFAELGIPYLACGHYATETLGIKALTKKLQQELKNKVKIEFMDLPNPL